MNCYFGGRICVKTLIALGFNYAEAFVRSVNGQQTVRIGSSREPSYAG